MGCGRAGAFFCLSLRSCRFVSATRWSSPSQCTASFHRHLFRAMCSQFGDEIQNFLRFVLMLSLNRFFCLPGARGPLSSSEYRICFGRRVSAMRMRWPVHQSWCFIIVVVMLDILASARTLMFVHLSSHLILSIFLKVLWWCCSRALRCLL